MLEVAEAVLAALTTEEMEAVDKLMLKKREEKELAEAPWTAWAAIGRATKRVLKCGLHKRLLAKVVQKSGVSRAMARDKLGVSVGRRMWKHVKNNGTKQTMTRRRWRLHDVEAVRKVLEDASAESSRMIGKGKDLKAVRALSDSKRQVYLKNRHLFGRMSMSAFYKAVKTSYREFRTAPRKLDQCEKCHQYDKSILPLIKRSVMRWMKDLNDIVPGYWKGWEAYSADVPADQKENFGPQYLQKMHQYVDTRVRQRGPSGTRLTYKQRGQVHAIEARICHEFTSK